MLECDEGYIWNGIIAEYNMLTGEIDYYGDVYCGEQSGFGLVVVILVYLIMDNGVELVVVDGFSKVYIGEFMNGHLHNDGYMYDVIDGDLQFHYVDQMIVL